MDGPHRPPCMLCYDKRTVGGPGSKTAKTGCRKRGTVLAVLASSLPQYECGVFVVVGTW